MTPYNFLAKVICKDKTPQRLSISNMMKVEVPANCAIELQHQVLLSESDDYSEEQETLHLEWEIPLDEVVPKINIPQSLNKTMTEMDQLQKELSTIGGWDSIKDIGSPLTNPILGGFMVGIALIVIGFTAFAIYSWRRMKRIQGIYTGPPLQEVPMTSIYTGPPQRNVSTGSNSSNTSTNTTASAPSIHSMTNPNYPDLNRP
jgi:hypothetical protein